MSSSASGRPGNHRCPWGPDFCKYVTSSEPDLRRHQSQKRHFGAPPSGLVAALHGFRQTTAVQQNQPVEQDAAGSRDADMQDEGMQVADGTEAQPMDAEPQLHLPEAASEDILAPNNG